MDIRIAENYEQMSLQTADFIADYVRCKPDAVVCFPAGDTPAGAFRRLVELSREGSVDFSRCTFIGLDEWVGLRREDEGSCQGFMYDKLFTPLGIAEERIFFFDACSADLAGECERMDEIVARCGGIDLMYVGMGMNGHIGLNEPGADMNGYSHVVELDAVTQTVGQKYFSRPTPLDKGITLGMKHLMEAETAVLAVSGGKKAGIVKLVLEGEVTAEVPASLLQRHPNCAVILDREAASGLSGALHPADNSAQ